MAKLIPANDPREVAVCGVMELASDPETALKAYQLSFSLERKSILQSGKFSFPPRVEDLASLTLSDSDIADLRTCTPGNCKLKLSAEMISRFQKSIDWTATHSQEQANQLFRSLIVEYVGAYLQKGDPALIEYADQSYRVRLAQQQESLLTNLLYVHNAAPEFVSHLKAFPRATVPVEHSLNWAVMNFGLKPVFVITDVATYRSGGLAGVRRVLILAKQIYASHYFDASMALTAVIADPSGMKSDLLYVNHSRSGALASSFSNLKHKIVERRAIDGLKNLLGQISVNLDVVRNNSSPSFQPTFIERIRESRILRIVALLVSLAAVGSALYVTVRSRLPHFSRPAAKRYSAKPSY